jgi:hypothetical protein
MGEKVRAFFKPARVPAPTPPSKGEAASAYGVGSAYYYYSSGGSGLVDCSPENDACYFDARVAKAVDDEGFYLVDWDDGDARSRRMTEVRRASTGTPCGGKAASASQAASVTTATVTTRPTTTTTTTQAPRKEAPKQGEDDGWTPPEIPCTILPRLHWEGSDGTWNKNAIEALRNAYKPDEVIDGFDWHVILRFNDADRCEQAYDDLKATLDKCAESDSEKCRTHDYVKAIEYVGDDPETRRKTGRKIHKDGSPRGRTEL